MIRLRKANDRGHADHGWLNTYFTFSFADYRDLDHMGFRSLRVMNEDRIAAGQGFGMHPHHDMEIVTYVLDGALEHKDSMGNGSVLQAGELQWMSAGTGITHSEFNPSDEKPVHLYQVWIKPSQKGLEPGYEQKSFDEQLRRGRWQVVASPDGSEESLKIGQDASVYLANLEPGQDISYELAQGRGAWLQVLRGKVQLNGQDLDTSDGAAINDEIRLEIGALEAAEVMLFDLA
jgi:redox-sensitive bicupin YhaK (pirin superfamily)